MEPLTVCRPEMEVSHTDNFAKSLEILSGVE
jgi:hypothetical protein